MSEFQLIRVHENNFDRNGNWRLHAGDLLIQEMVNGQWKNLAAFRPHERSAAERRLKELQDAALPQLFDDL